MHFLLPSYSQLLSVDSFFPGQQLTIHLKNIAYPNDCTSVSKGCSTSGVKFEFTVTLPGKENEVLQQRDLKNTKTDAQFKVGDTQPSMPFLPMGSSRYLEKQKQQDKGKRILPLA